MGHNEFILSKFSTLINQKQEMRITFFILLMLSLSACGTSKFQKQLDKGKRLSEKEFTVVSSEIKSWVGGIKGA